MVALVNPAKYGVFEGIREHGNGKNCIFDIYNGETDAIQGYGSFGDDIRQEMDWSFEGNNGVLALGSYVRDFTDAVDVTLNEVAVHFIAEGYGGFEIDLVIFI